MRTLAVLFLMMIVLAGCRDEVTVTFIPRGVDDEATVSIEHPAEGEVIPAESVSIQFRVENVNISRDEHAIRVVLDNGPIIAHYSDKPFLLASLPEGRHVVRAFLVNRWGESLKNDKAFAIQQFYVKKIDAPLLNFNAPIVTYNEPVGFVKDSRAKRVLLDFLVKNVVLSEDGYRVVYSLDGVTRELFDDGPVYLTHLQKGIHRVGLELRDKNGNLAEGYFVKTARDIVIESFE